MPTGLIVFARMSSSRCPGKMLMPIAGRPLLGLVLDRTRLVKNADRIVVATSTEPGDDAIAVAAIKPKRQNGADIPTAAYQISLRRIPADVHISE